MFERHDEPLISRRRFAYRVAASLGIAIVIDSFAVVIGALGYHGLEGADWLTAFVNAAMVISGNGLVSRLQTRSAEIFSIFDALFGVMAFISVASVVLVPIFHRVLHTFHLEVHDK